MRSTIAAGLLATVLLLATAACSGDDDAGAEPGGSSATAPGGTSTPATSSSPPSSSASSPGQDRVLRPHLDGVLATGLDVPWGLAFLPDGSALVSERESGRIKRVGTDGKVTDVGAVQGVDGSGEGGLLGLAISPSYASDRLVFAYLTAGEENRVVRMRYDGSQLRGQRTILDGIVAGPIHDGGRIAFGPDGYLYIGTGEAGRLDPAQDLQDLGGKILRIAPDGDPAPGNPFDGSPVYSYGHRNVQGLAWDERGQLWASEFGQNEWDELNRIRPGGNYGWPRVEGKAGDDRYVDPVRQWHTDVASPSGIAIAGNAVYMAALRGTRLWEIPIPGGLPGKPRALLTGDYGRLRTVGVAPDGSLWVTTSNRDGRGSPTAQDDRIIRLTLS